MNKKLQNIFNLIEQNKNLTAEEKESALKALKDADKELEITAFKLERTEKVKKTTAILLEETIEELELKRKAVEEKNRELEIEASLEKVRASAMSIHKSEDLLSVSEILYGELRKLGFNEMRNAMINIHNDANKTFLNYDYSDEIGKSATLLDYNAHPVMEKQIKQSRIADDAFSEAVFKGKDLEAMKEFRRKYGEKDDPRIKNITALYYYFYSIGNGTIGISTFIQIDENKLSLLKRFRNVFNLAYKRYSDITLAEAQAREAQIQLALERVRARTMAMYKSDELSETAQVLFQQFSKLGENPDQLSIAIVNEFEKVLETWLSVQGNQMNRMFKASVDEPIVINKIYTAWKTKKRSLIIDISGNELEKYNEFRNSLDEFKDYNVIKNNFSKEENRRVIYCAFFSQGMLSLATPEPRPTETLKLLERFAGVFNLTYTRFLDLQKAEAQAKEAEIELSLERIRARSMAMQKSEELKEVIKLVYEQFVHLKINVDHAGFVVDYTPKGDWHFWIADQQEIPSKITHPYFDSVWAHQFNEAKEKGIDFFATNLNFEEKNKFYNELLSYVPGLPDKSKEFYLSCPGLAATTVLFDNVSLYIENFSGTPYTDEENKILLRFGKVFQQTYTRFLDLQKAEAQTREAQIELALERVRARTMAMQNSEELQDAAILLFDQIKSLGVPTGSCGFNIWEKEESAVIVWMSSAEGGLQKPFKLPHTESVIYKQVYSSKKKGDDLLVKEVRGEELKKHFNYLTTVPVIGDIIKNLRKTGYQFPGKIIYHFAFFAHGYLSFHLHDPHPEAKEIFKRFAKVFNQTYTRFLDLQKAELQAREAQIEASLEKVRAVAMSMNKSDDLISICEASFKEFQKLGFINIRNALIHILNDEKGFFWDYDYSDIVGESINKIFYKSHPILEDYLKQIKSADDAFAEIIIGADQLNSWKEFRNKSGQSEDPRLDDATAIYYYLFSIGIGDIGISTFKPIDESQIKILKRFRNVFDLAYRRYNDIALAEEQARETQIQLALERVRAKAMAMHKSEDLAKSVFVVFEELESLNLGMLRCGIGIMNKQTRSGRVWTTVKTAEGGTAQVSGDESMEIHPMLDNAFNAWKNGEDFDYILEGNDLVKYYKALGTTNFNLPEFQKAKSSKKEYKQYYYQTPVKQVGGLFAFRESPFPDEAKQIMKRFANVINLTYTRFYDLQIAEAQARETQIQLALERVRARTMAMHKSEELSETSFVLFEQLKELGEVADQMSITIYDEKEGIAQLYSTIYGNKWEETGRLPFKKHIVLRNIHRAWKEKKKSIVIDLFGEELNDFNNFKMKYSTQYKSERELPKNRWVMHYVFFSNGAITFSSHEPRPPETIQLLERFTGVFDLTYTRFLDLQKAESQAREAHIEAALERVRSRSMAMHHTSELQDVINTVHQQFKILDIAITGGAFIAINEENKNEITCWGAGETADYVERVHIPFLDRPIYTGLIKCIQQGPGLFTEEFSYEEKIEFFNYLFKHSPYSESSAEHKKEILSRKGGYTRSSYVSKHTCVFIINHQGRKFSEEENNILIRFGKVFEQSYTRFLDLQKAEAQAREAQIEVALERVRARTMAMQKSDELRDASLVLFQQLKELGEPAEQLTIGIVNEVENIVEVSATLHGDVLSNTFGHSIDEPQMMQKIFKSWKAKEKTLEIKLQGEELKKYNQYRNSVLGSNMFPTNIDPDFYRISYMAFFSKGFLALSTNEPRPVESIQILERFSKAFNLTYTRFLDLKNAEAQAREAQIEAALERVRAKAMAMHSSNDLSETMGVLFTELPKLGINSLRCGVVLLSKNNTQGVFYAAATTQESDSFTMIGSGDMTNHPIFMRQYENWLQKENYFVTLSGEDLQSYYKEIFARLSKTYNPREHKLKTEHGYYFSFSEGMFYAWSEEPYSNESLTILNRFNAIIDLTFRRYLDIKKAEEQAREAQIEAALERVRSKAMAMNSSEDLAITVDTFFSELNKLNIVPHRCGVGIIDSETRMVDIRATAYTKENVSKKIVGSLKLAGHPILDEIFETWKLQKEYHPVLRGNEILDYYKVMNPQVEFPDFAEDDIQYGHYFHFKEGGVFAWTDKDLVEEDLQIFRRYTSVLSLTYRRYIELKEAEKQAIVATKQASLDRVRAEIASMRTSEDLNRITPVIWRELKNLDVPFFRCGVYIVDEKTEMVQVYLTTPDGKSLGVLNLSFDSNEITSNTVDYWQKKQVYKTHWDKEEFINWTKTMMRLGQIQSTETYQGSTTPPESLHLHFVPFAQGMLYVGDVNPLTEEKLDLVKTLAEAFSIAYARYEDFKNLEGAKNKIEITLNELKSAQAQLIHSEKMASLGELTAGIAHEIKNPLNFVNNFSEVSRELLDEMKTELNNKNIEDVIDLVEDLKQNLDKINQHGKRADSIVKGMLLHSRGTSGEKTPTDINDLLDQYVNLAYHGMRATNKEFNISIEKDYDDSLEKISVVPQDISRVFLNIINNACYAAFNKKNKADDNNFSPTLKVSTKKINDRVEIKIGDNGNGIPSDHLDKIFQPFFTTKPSGEGTGLGLSLSYDIVTKVHGGELKVETENGMGSTFIIELKKN